MKLASNLRHSDEPDTIQVGGLRLQVVSGFEAIREKWLALEQIGIATVFQSYHWCETWHQEIGYNAGVVPLIVVAENNSGDLQFILPLQMRLKWKFNVIEIYSAPQAGYGFGLFDRTFLHASAAEWFQINFEGLLAVLPAHDVVNLTPLPSKIAECHNPLLATAHLRAANSSYIMTLDASYQALLEQHRSPETRRSLRKRDNKLEALGMLVFDLPTQPADVEATLQTMFEDQQLRLAEAGVHDVYNAQERIFISKLATRFVAGNAILRPYRLQLDGKILAVMMGAYFQDTYWALISSLADSDARKYSPGDYALRAMIAALTADGTRYLDFSAGDTAYKTHWADEQIELSSIIRASTWRGLMLATYLLFRSQLKRLLKNNTFMRKASFALRKHYAGSRRSS